MKILYAQTGGTIDKDYPCGETHHGYEFVIAEPAVASIVPKIQADFDYEIISLFQKDSLDITDEDRELMRTKIDSLPEKRIVITHGTDTILKTAEVLSKIREKIIVLTGAMLPEKFTTSDAKFNVGMATAAVQVLPAGVYIALFGRVYPWKEFAAAQEEFNRRLREQSIEGQRDVTVAKQDPVADK